MAEQQIDVAEEQRMVAEGQRVVAEEQREVSGDEITPPRRRYHLRMARASARDGPAGQKYD